MYAEYYANDTLQDILLLHKLLVMGPMTVKSLCNNQNHARNTRSRSTR